MTHADRRTRVAIPGQLFMYGASLWLVGSFDWALWGWFFDPAVSKVGKATMLLSAIAFVAALAPAIVAGSFAPENMAADK